MSTPATTPTRFPSSSERGTVRALRLAVAVALSAASLAAQAAVTHTCPARVTIASATVVIDGAPAGLAGRATSAPLALTGVSVYDGPPEQGAALKPENDNARRPVWRFEGPYPEGKWLTCDYARGVVQVPMRIGDTSVRCQATIGPEGKSPRVQASLRCE